MRVTRCAVVLVGLVLATAARADRGAFTLDVGGNFSMLRLSAPMGSGGGHVQGTTQQVQLGARYALRNAFEVGVVGFWERPTTYRFKDTSITTENGTFDGRLDTQTSAYGAGASLRFITGTVWRVFVGGEAGIVHRSYSNLDLVDSSGSSYGLGLSSKSLTGLYAAPFGGVEWAFADRWSVSAGVRPVFEFTEGMPLALTIPLQLSYSFY